MHGSKNLNCFPFSILYFFICVFLQKKSFRHWLRYMPQKHKNLPIIFVFFVWTMAKQSQWNRILQFGKNAFYLLDLYH